MRTLLTATSTIVGIGCLLAGDSSRLNAQDPASVGIARIHDGGPSASRGAAGGVRHVAYSAAAGWHGPIVHAAAGCPSCGHGDHYCPACGNGGEWDDGEESSVGKLCSWLGCHSCLGCCHGHHSPDHGWGRPVKQPIHRLPVLYQKSWPDRWYGTRGSKLSGARAHYYPMVYRPTDTTQLGYYYQGVPFWRPNARRLPPVPWPGQWHKRECITSQATAAAAACGQEVETVTEPQLEPAPTPQEQPEEAPPPPTLKDDLNKSAARVGRRLR